ncbi:MAG TPA: O-succinylhomoserine sulfhydrylase [Burkholderiales bacterium]|jgi:O-succinylhomoserine sulfhydrylase|nr:O-succinylhomoserine sulfhydrylase [Burkholderiales bacterium]
MSKDYELATKGVRAGQARTEFQEHSEALFLTSSFVFKNARQAAARFAGEDEGMVYTRYTNPTVAMLQDRLAALEGAESCVATASGMSAILTTAMTHLRSGDHVVCSNAVFGATIQLFNNVLSRFGVETTYVSPTKAEEWQRAVRGNTRLFFLETPSNPLTEVSDIAALSAIAKKAGALLAVDNVFCTPALQRPLALGADIVIHSATKYLDGQGRVIAGAVAGSKALVGAPMTAFLRTAGPTLSPFNAWVVLKGLETLELRMLAQSAAALELARWLEARQEVSKVFYPGLPSHPQHELAKRQQRAAGAVLSFEVKGGRAAAWRLIDSTRLVSVTANLGDVKTTIVHPASTTHGRISPEARAAAGIGEGLVRLAVGLEAVADLKVDLQRGLEAE